MVIWLGLDQNRFKPDSQGPKPPKTLVTKMLTSARIPISNWVWILEGTAVVVTIYPELSIRYLLSTTDSPRMTTIDNSKDGPGEGDGWQRAVGEPYNTGDTSHRQNTSMANKLRIDSIESTNTAGSGYVCSNFILNFAAWLKLPVAFKAFKRLTVVCETKRNENL